MSEVPSSPYRESRQGGQQATLALLRLPRSIYPDRTVWPPAVVEVSGRLSVLPGISMNASGKMFASAPDPLEMDLALCCRVRKQARARGGKLRLIPVPLNTCASCLEGYSGTLGYHCMLHSNFSDLVLELDQMWHFLKKNGTNSGAGKLWIVIQATPGLGMWAS
jgi:hypothetical protein